jgi:hypothetical protein
MISTSAHRFGTLVPDVCSALSGKIQGMEFDAGGLQILDRQECMALLAVAPLGRIVFTQHALPAVQPVNFALAGEDVIIRTTEGSKLAAATAGAIVAFEIDDYDVARRRGWSVVIVGLARRVADPAELAALRALPLCAWAPGHRDHFIRISPEIVTGRRILREPTDGTEDSARQDVRP